MFMILSPDWVGATVPVVMFYSVRQPISNNLKTNFPNSSIAVYSVDAMLKMTPRLLISNNKKVSNQ